MNDKISENGTFFRAIETAKKARRGALVLVLAGTVSACGGPTEQAPEREAVTVQSAVTLAASTALCNSDPRVDLGLVSLDVCVGAELFFRDSFGGNGRSCASCHPADNNYTIDPISIAALPPDDPLFVAENEPALVGLERPDLMRNFGLILENVDGLEDPTVKFAMRSVPHCLSLGTSVTAQLVPNDGTTRPPNERTGWSGDGAPNDGELRDFQTGAVIQHYPQSLNRTTGVDFILPTPAELDAIDAFTRTIGRTNELDLTAVALTDANAEAGRVLFQSPAARCNGCHNNAGANVAAAFNRNFNTGVENARIATLDTQEIPVDGGFGGGGLPSFNFDSNGDAVLDSFGNGTFNTTPLIEAADTGPFFHTNAFTSIEDAVGFYNTAAFNQSPAGTPNVALSPSQVASIGRFLRVINAAFNAQMAIARVNGALPIIIAEKNHFRPLQQELLRLALVEVEDALEVLSAASALNTSVQADLSAAQGFLQVASTHASHTQRRRNAEDALLELNQANAGLGTGMSFVMGQGTLMF